MFAGNKNFSVFVIDGFLNEQERILAGKRVLFCREVPGGRVGAYPVAGGHFLIAAVF